MALNVMVLYDDLSIRVEPFENIDALPKDRVLALTMTTALGDRKGLVARSWGRDPRQREGLTGEWWGVDNYAIVQIGTSFFTDQWDDDDEAWRLRWIADPHDLGPPRRTLNRPSRFPSNATVHRFKGTYVSPEEWKIALAKFEAEMF